MDLIPYRVRVLYAALNVFVFLIPNWLVLGKSASHEENGGHLVVFYHSSLVGHLDYFRDVGTTEVGLPGFFFTCQTYCVYLPILTYLILLALDSALLDAMLCYLLGLVAGNSGW